jgi:hypothetical protein
MSDHTNKYHTLVLVIHTAGRGPGPGVYKEWLKQIKEGRCSRVSVRTDVGMCGWLMMGLRIGEGGH